MNIIKYLERLFQEKFAQCECGHTFSEWFIHFDERQYRDVMYCYSCKRQSEYANHQEYRDALTD